MGTRGLTAVQQDGEYKVAQYGQWDHYPEGQGSTIAKFLDSILASQQTDLFGGSPFEVFCEKIAQVQELTEAECEAVNAELAKGEKSLSRDWPELSRDTGGEILGLIFNSDEPVKLVRDITFAADSLFCEYAYVVDLDKGTFEIFKGFNDDRPLVESDRFFGMESKDDLSYRTNKYYGVTLLKSFDLQGFNLDQYDAWLDEYNRSLEEEDEDFDESNAEQ